MRETTGLCSWVENEEIIVQRQGQKQTVGQFMLGPVEF